jgi:hypothetical protein
MNPTYEVIVGNIGTVYQGCIKSEAYALYLSYRRDSMQQYGRAAGEAVTLMIDGETAVEYFGGLDL